MESDFLNINKYATALQKIEDDELAIIKQARYEAARKRLELFGEITKAFIDAHDERKRMNDVS